jgi:hypothetical protein
VRSAIGAGGTGEPSVFRDEKTKNEFYEMWKYVAAHYKDKDYIAAYEIMSEPRD